MNCSHLKGKVLVQILKPVYGLTVAPRRWWQQVCKDLLRLGWIQSKVEPRFWYVLEVLMAGGCRPIVLLIVHVDDFPISGNPKDQRFQRLRTGLLKLYEWQPWERGSFEQTGSSVEQLRDFDFRITQPRFAESADPITVDRSRRNQPEHETDAREKTALRALLGAVLWRASQSAPWLSVVLSFLLSEVPRWLRCMRPTSCFGRCGGRHSCLCASLAIVVTRWRSSPIATLPGLAELTAPATGGYIVFFCWRGYFDGDVCALVPIAWSSHKLQRICQSSLGAEIQGIPSAQDELDFCRLLWYEITVGTLNLEGLPRPSRLSTVRS